MEILERSLGCVLLSTNRLNDNRGWFRVGFSIADLHRLDIRFDHVEQLNHSHTEHAGVIRGLNYQEDPFAQAKAVSCVTGAVYSVGVDITPTSPTFGQWCGWVLSPGNHRVMVVPCGYAHGFITLRDDTELQYLTDNAYSRKHAKSIRCDDPDLSIDWTMNGVVSPRVDILSAKNRDAPCLHEAIHGKPVA